MTETLAQRIRRHEGCRLMPYKDNRGFWTIGIGHKMVGQDFDTMMKGISQKKADGLFAIDLDKASKDLAHMLSWTVKLDQLRRGILIEMTFQLGIPGLLKFKHMLTACETGDYTAATN